MMKQKYALVIGGTGMLQNVCHWLAEEGYFLSVINRKIEHFEEMRRKSPFPNHFHNILVDYHDEEKLNNKLTKAFKQYSTPDLVVSWIHSSAPKTLGILLEHFTQRKNYWKLFHIQGSASYFIKEDANVPRQCHYHRVYLGFVIENAHSRWLTNEEISEGIIQAIKQEQSETIVGTLEPWCIRP